MKTPITYYGGKQKLVKDILPLIPKHTLYCEPFIGGGAIFFSKPKSKVEVINDTNREMINFYRVAQTDFVSLEREISISLHSRSLHRDAKAIYENPHLFSELKRAWAVWILSTQSFCSGLDKAWGYDIKKNSTSLKIKNKREAFTEEVSIRLQDVQIECADALRIITSRDNKDAFFYCDPPYYNSDMGHYDGYTIDDFENLLKSLSKIEGKFMLSSYPSELLSIYTKKHKWFTKTFTQTVTVNNLGDKPNKKKIEVLTTNYPI